MLIFSSSKVRDSTLLPFLPRKNTKLLCSRGGRTLPQSTSVIVISEKQRTKFSFALWSGAGAVSICRRSTTARLLLPPLPRSLQPHLPRAAANAADSWTFRPQRGEGQAGPWLPLSPLQCSRRQTCSGCPLAPYCSHGLPATHSPNLVRQLRCWQGCFSGFLIKGGSSGPAHPGMISCHVVIPQGLWPYFRGSISD